MERVRLLGNSFDCDCGHTHSVPVLRVEIGRGVTAQLPTLMQALFIDGSGFLVCDETTWDVAGKSILALGIHGLHKFVIPSGRPHADLETAEEVKNAVIRADYLIACGSGTVTDLTKYAAHRLGVPCIAMATAPSMNGYTSGIVALTVGGLKKTLPVTPVLGMIGDTDILAQAPLAMIQAGLGDLVSKPVCNADWKLASMIRGEHFCALPSRLIADLEAIYLPQASAIPSRDPKVIHALIEAIAYSGISMILAGSSAPASGGEHLISHSLDMQRGLQGEEPLDFHGTQVGVATLTTARLYEYFLQLRHDDIDWDAAMNHWKPIDALAPALSATWGEAGDAVIAAFQKKHPATLEDHHREIETIKARWTELQDAVRPLVAGTPAIAKALKAAGAKTTHKDLGLTDAAFATTIRGARFIRERYTILDLLDTTGELTSALHD